MGAHCHRLTYPDDVDKQPDDHYSAIDLFAKCTRHLRSDFSLEAERDSVVRIELAAGWTMALMCTEIAAEIQRNLDFLSSETRNLPERHRSMQAVFDHSWRFLTEDERATMRRFAVFWGGCTRDAAAQVTGASLKALAGLVVKSMLRYDPARGRYDVQDLLHQYAHEQLLAAGDSDAVHDAHCGYYVDFMRERGDDIKGRRQLAGLNEIEVDFNNVRVAWEYAVGHADYDAPDGMMECLVLFCEWKRSFLRENTALPSTSDTSLSIIALTFHSDGNIYGAHPGDSGLNSHVHIFAPIPPM